MTAAAARLKAWVADRSDDSLAQRAAGTAFLIRCVSAALVYLDLDGFKPINDRHGHAAGDAVLKAAAMVLARHVRSSDLVARIGGDEFVTLLWHIDESDAHAKARALEAAIARMTATHDGATLSIQVSAGAGMLLPLDTPASALERADRAMYARKSARRAALSA